MTKRKWQANGLAVDCPICGHWEHHPECPKCGTHPVMHSQLGAGWSCRNCSWASYDDRPDRDREDKP